MGATKVVTLRLTDDMIARVDAVVATGFENRSDALRSLIDAGIDKDALDLKIQQIGQDVEEKLFRMMHVVEMLYQLTYINTSLAVNERDDLKAKLPGFKTMANEDLVNSLIKKFGE
jgi:Arc/MetJ-type ribon-helix-helix transcriptional regulator